jgi:RNA polymerase sigma-70 factor, ECF subfamily
MYTNNAKEKIRIDHILTNAHHDFEKGLNARAYFKTHNTEMCGDLVQDTFLKTWSYLVKGGKIDIMKAFLYHILNNLIIDQYRKHKTMSLDKMTENGFEVQTSDDEEERTINKIDGSALVLLLKLLPEIYQKVIRMRYIQDLSITEISILTGISKNAIGVQIHRGLIKLKILHDHS